MASGRRQLSGNTKEMPVNASWGNNKLLHPLAQAY